MSFLGARTLRLLVASASDGWRVLVPLLRLRLPLAVAAVAGPLAKKSSVSRKGTPIVRTARTQITVNRSERLAGAICTARPRSRQPRRAVVAMLLPGVKRSVSGFPQNNLPHENPSPTPWGPRLLPRMRYAGSRRLPAPPHILIHLRPSQLAPQLAPPLSRSSDVVPGLGERVARLVSARRRGHAPLVLLVRVKVRVAVRVEV